MLACRQKMKVLIACEFSGIVRDAFLSRGHDAISCDFLPSERPGPHYQGDVFDIIDQGFDLMICHPPCTHLAVSGARWFSSKKFEQYEAIRFAKRLLDAPVPRICLENPVSVLSTKIRKANQVLQPWQFGHPETKATLLWLKNLPLLRPTNVVSGRSSKIHCMPPSPDRWKNRSRTYFGITRAIAEQWGNIKALPPVLIQRTLFDVMSIPMD